MVIEFKNLAAPIGTRGESLDGVIVSACELIPKARMEQVQSLDKKVRRALFANASTQWSCISLIEGLNPAARISAENPPAYIHGVVADFDDVGARFSAEGFEERCKGQAYPPNVVGHSLGGGVHAIWLLEESIPVLGDIKYAAKVLTELHKNICTSSLFTGFDSAFLHPKMLITLAPHNLFLYSNVKVGAASTRLWVNKVTRDFKFVGDEVELDKVKPIIDEMFPGRWEGDFVEGARGVRFWDATATDTTGAMVTKAGMVYFTNGGGFKPWGEIIGVDKVSHINAARMELLTDRWWYVQSIKEYVRYNPTEESYVRCTRQQLTDRLMLAGLNKPEERVAAIVYIEDHRSVWAIVAAANQRKGIIYLDNVAYLNTTTTSHITPSPGDWGFINRMLTAQFGEEALPYFMSWLKIAVIAMREGRQAFGQAIFFCGGVQTGKSLLQYRILSPLFGGRSANPGEYLLGETSFNSELLDAGHWLVSDQYGIRSNDSRGKFDQNVKAMTANPMMKVHPKYGTPVVFPVNCRCTFSLNMTQDSLSVLPRQSSDTADKYMLFGIKQHDVFQGMSQTQIESAITQELPHFLDWLLNVFDTPSHVKSDCRFKVKSWKEPELLRHVKDSQGASEMISLLHMVFGSSIELKKLAESETGASFSAMEWMRNIHMMCGPGFHMTAGKVVAHFVELAAQYPNAITWEYDAKTKHRCYTVKLKKLYEASANESMDQDLQREKVLSVGA